MSLGSYYTMPMYICPGCPYAMGGNYTARFPQAEDELENMEKGEAGSAGMYRLPLGAGALLFPLLLAPFFFPRPIPQPPPFYYNYYYYGPAPFYGPRPLPPPFYPGPVY